jgi:ankyrin repeat protein
LKVLAVLLRYDEPNQAEVEEAFAQARKLAADYNVNDTVEKDDMDLANIYQVNLGIITPYYISLIEFAARFGNIITIKHLINNHIDALQKQPGNLSSAILWVVKENHYEALELLINNPDILNTVIEKCPKKLGDATCEAVYNKNNEALKLLINNPDILNTVIEKCPEKLGDAIYWASTNGHDEALALLLSNQDIVKAISAGDSYNLSRAIWFAADKGYYKALALLLSNQDIVKALLAKRPESLQNLISNVIRDAAKNGHNKALMLLLSNAAIVDKVIKDCYSYLCGPIDLAAEYGHIKALELLLTIINISEVPAQTRDILIQKNKY